MFCENCGNAVEKDSRYCPSCGRKVVAATEIHGSQHHETKPLTFRAYRKENNTVFGDILHPRGNYEFMLTLNSPLLILVLVLFFIALFMNSYTGEQKWWSYYILVCLFLGIFWYLVNRKKLNTLIFDVVEDLKKGE